MLHELQRELLSGVDLLLLSIYQERCIIIFALVVIFIIFLYRWVLRPAWFSPLSKVAAAHPLAPFTSLWMTWKRYSGREFETVESAFRANGPIVRLGPRELGVNVVERGIRTVYGGHGYHKPEWYDHFINYGCVPINQPMALLSGWQKIKEREERNIYIYISALAGETSSA